MYLPKKLAALHSRRKIEFNFRPECQAESNADQFPRPLARTEWAPDQQRFGAQFEYSQHFPT
jgi:hypothetical protein